MPRLLKNETQQRIVVSQQALRLAFSLLSNPKAVGYERQSTDGALEMGLIGTAADLAISACLYEIYGHQGIIREDSGFFLTASEALSKFRRTLSSAFPRLEAISSGVKEPQQHLGRFKEACSSFAVIFTARASALHAGAGTSYDVAFFAGKSVASFLSILAESQKWKPYLRDIPDVPALPKDRRLLAQELATAVSSKDKTLVTSGLSGLFLVLPELSSKEPEWLSALQRVQVTPRRKDIAILITTLKKANIGDIVKVGKGTQAMPIKIDKSNPLGLPVYPQAMKKKFENLHDQWAGYVATANAELDKNILSLPPVEAIYRFSAFGIENIGLPDEEIQNGLSAHSIWPFIAGALHYQGTKGPCFFVARIVKPTEAGQLSALLRKTGGYSKRIEKALIDYEPLLIAAAKHELVKCPSDLATSLIEAVRLRETKRQMLVDKLQKRSTSSQPAYQDLISVVGKYDALEQAIMQVATDKVEFGSEKLPVLRLLIEAATERDDIKAIDYVEKRPELKAETQARKAIREIDCAFFGPQSQ